MPLEKLLDIAEVASRTGVSASGLRYYEKRGLIASVSRNGLRRQYEPDVLSKIALVLLGKSAGFTLDEIGGILRQPTAGKLPPGKLIDKADALERQAEELQMLSKMLRHVAHCPEEDHFGCARFQKLLKVATRRVDNRHQNSETRRSGHVS